MRIGSVIFALVGTTAGHGSIAAAAGPCAGVRIHGATDLPPRWADAVGRLAVELPPVAESACASVTLAIVPSLDGAARLVAMTADGRYAERTIQRPAALVATTLGLLASIPEEAPRFAGPEAAQTSQAVTRPFPAAMLGTAPPPPPPPPGRFQLWLGGSLGARIGEPTGYQLFDLETRADAILHGWLLSLTFRYDTSLGPDTSDFVLDEAIVGIGVGHRIPLGRSVLDLEATSAFAAMDLRWDQDDSDPQSESNSVFLFGISARWSTPINRSWWFTVTADGDAAPQWIEHPSNLGADEPAFPTWSAGLRIGASGAVL